MERLPPTQDALLQHTPSRLHIKQEYAPNPEGQYLSRPIHVLNWLSVTARVKEDALVDVLVKMLCGIALNCANVNV